MKSDSPEAAEVKTADSSERLDTRSADPAELRRQELLRAFPEARTEGGRIDFDRLRLALGETVDTGRERFGLNWPGKANCFRVIQQPSVATLRPVPEESVEFDTTENLIIEGDNLEVLKLLQKSYLGKVKMIYIDPPYNTGNDFIYPDDFSETLQTYLQYTGQVDAEGRKFGTNSDTQGRFHSRWLNMMYPRLYLARNLLRDDGLIFVSCDDNEVHNLRSLMNEVFGEENFVATLVWHSEGHTDNQFDVKVTHEYVALYSRDASAAVLGHVIDPNTRPESNLWRGFAENSITKNGPGNPPSEVLLPIGFPCRTDEIDLSPTVIAPEFMNEVNRTGFISRELTARFEVEYPIRLDRMLVTDGRLAAPCRILSGWANADKLRAFIRAGCVPLKEGDDSLSFFLSPKGVVYYRRDRTSARNIVSVLRNLGTTERARSELEAMGVLFQYPKPMELISYLVRIGCGSEGIVLDFFAGSGVTGHSVLAQNEADGGNRRFVLVQLPEPLPKPESALKTIADITKARVRRVVQNIEGERVDKASQAPGLLSESVQAAPTVKPGFRVFALAESNFTAWQANATAEGRELAEQLTLHVDHIRAGRSDRDLLFEILLKSGFPLTIRVDERTMAGKKVYSAADGAFLICLDRDLTLDVIRAMADASPSRIVCLDEGFAGNDQLKANAVQIFRTKKIESFKTV